MQRAIELMGEFDGFASVAALAGQGRQGDGERAQGDGVIGADDALVAQAEAASEIEAARQGAEVLSWSIYSLVCATGHQPPRPFRIRSPVFLTDSRGDTR